MGHIIDLEVAHTVIKSLKDYNRRIVFTHGAYDIFHCGHAYFLNKSKKRGDVLIVGVESDENVGKYKGYPRPIIKERNRAEVVASQQSVDFVFINKQGLGIQYYKKLYAYLGVDIITVGYNHKLLEDYDNVEAKLNVTKIPTPSYIRDTSTSIINSILSSHYPDRFGAH